jgi:hypothetical protein
MGYSGGKITRPVKINNSAGDVELAIGVNSGDYKTLCTSTKINPWAKYKPTNFNTYGETGKSVAGSIYWKGIDGKCGFAFPVYYSLGSLSSGFIRDMYYGAINVPIWGRSFPTSQFRALDFDGYDHNSVNPIGAIAATTFALDEYGQMQISFDTNAVGADNLKYSDFVIDGVSVSTFYPSVLLVRGSNYIVCSSTSRLSDGSFEINLTNMAPYTGQWYCIPFLSSVQLSQTGQYGYGIYISCNINKVLITINQYQPVLVASVDGIWNTAFTSVAYSCTVTNNKTSSHTFNNLEIAIVRTTGTQDPSAGTKVASAFVSSFTLPAGQSTIKTGNISITKQSGYTYWIVALATGLGCDYNQIEESI